MQRRIIFKKMCFVIFMDPIFVVQYLVSRAAESRQKMRSLFILWIAAGMRDLRSVSTCGPEGAK